MLRDNSTDLINQFILAEHKELNSETIFKYNRDTYFKYLMYCFLNIINIKSNEKK